MCTRRFLLLCVALCTTPAPAQMEKRSDELYGPAFATADPAIGTAAPDLVLADVDGRPVAISNFKGAAVVIVKGGFT